MPIPKAAEDIVTSTDQGMKNMFILCYVQSNTSEEASATYRHDRTTISNERHRSNMSGLSKQRGTKKCQYEVNSETKGSESERRQTPRRKPRKALNPKKKRKLNKSRTKTSNNQSEVSHTKTNKNKSDNNPKKNEGCDYLRRRKKSDVEKKKCAWKLKPPTFYCSNTLTIAKSIFYASLTLTKRDRQETTRSLSLHHNPVVKSNRRCNTNLFGDSITFYETKLSLIQGCSRLGEKEGRIGNLRTEEEVRRLKIVSKRTQRRTKILINILATNNNKMVGPRPCNFTALLRATFYLPAPFSTLNQITVKATPIIDPSSHQKIFFLGHLTVLPHKSQTSSNPVGSEGSDVSGP